MRRGDGVEGLELMWMVRGARDGDDARRSLGGEVVQRTGGQRRDLAVCVGVGEEEVPWGSACRRRGTLCEYVQAKSYLQCSYEYMFRTYLVGRIRNSSPPLPLHPHCTHSIRVRSSE